MNENNYNRCTVGSLINIPGNGREYFIYDEGHMRPMILCTLQPHVNRTFIQLKLHMAKLIMALHATGAFNNGKISIKQIVTQLGSFFNVRLDNFYQIGKSARGRKKMRMAYLHHMIERGEKKMDDTDIDF